jgi:nitroreductase
MSLSPFQRLLEVRQSVRRYAERPVSENDILSLVEAARQAPSAENAQPCRFVAVTDPAAREGLARACFSGIFSPTRFAAAAPLIIALCAERATMVEAGKAIKDRAMYQLDCGIAGEHLVLRAAELGLGTCWIGWFNRRAARRALGAPFHVQVVCLIAAGYPAQDAQPRRRVRRPVSSILWKDKWGEGFPGAPSEGQNRK